ncbi:MAG TPA: branched-chain amino acid ABC transporter permease [Anaerovoracaceae bacterium]|nr:branched-chain amino acid ABC transporter permease [Anaerovoracaceae bacterium]
MSVLLQVLTDGLILGGVYAVIAVGLSLIFGVMRIVNFAHGAFVMVGMYFSYVIVTYLSLNPYIAMVVVAGIMFAIGFLLQKYVFNNLLQKEKAREPMSVLMFTAGLEMVLIYVAQMIFTATPVMTQTDYVGLTFMIGDTVIVFTKAVAFGVALLATFALYIFLRKTETGRAMRATSQNRAVARLMGINEKRIYCLSFGIGCAIVGLSAGLLVPYFPITPTVGSTFGLKSFVIVVLGGKGSIMGALLGGLLIGIVSSVVGQYLNMAYAEIIVFLIFVAVLIFKPSGFLSKDLEY